MRMPRVREEEAAGPRHVQREGFLGGGQESGVLERRGEPGVTRQLRCWAACWAAGALGRSRELEPHEKCQQETVPWELSGPRAVPSLSPRCGPGWGGDGPLQAPVVGWPGGDGSSNIPPNLPMVSVLFLNSADTERRPLPACSVSGGATPYTHELLISEQARETHALILAGDAQGDARFCQAMEAAKWQSRDLTRRPSAS